MNPQDANTALDLLRLLVVPFFAWAAYTDVRTRRIPNQVWPPLFLLGVGLLAATVWLAFQPGAPYPTTVLPATVVSLGVVAPVAYLFWLFGGFGGADAKALLVLSLLFPIYPAYELAGVVFPNPTYENALGSFAFTILTNTVLAGILYPAGLFVRNAANGEFALPMFLGERVHASRVDRKYGTLMRRNDGMRSGSLDLDALRMYLQWRGTTLDAIRDRADELRDPSSLPDDRNDPGGGEIEMRDEVPVAEPDGGDPSAEADATRAEGGDDDDEDAEYGDDEDAEYGDDEDAEYGDDEDAEYGDDEDAEYDDSWGAEAFLDEIEGDAYGTTPDALRDGLGVLADADRVWVSPGIPFIVPMFVGLLVAILFGDLVTALIVHASDLVALVA